MTFRAVTSSQLTFSNAFQVSWTQVSQVLPMLQPVPYGALVVLWKRVLQNHAGRPPWNSLWGV